MRAQQSSESHGEVGMRSKLHSPREQTQRSKLAVVASAMRDSRPRARLDRFYTRTGISSVLAILKVQKESAFEGTPTCPHLPSPKMPIRSGVRGRKILLPQLLLLVLLAPQFQATGGWLVLALGVQPSACAKLPRRKPLLPRTCFLSLLQLPSAGICCPSRPPSATVPIRILQEY